MEEKREYTKEEKKTIIAYCVELAIIAVIFLTIGILELFSIVKPGDNFVNVFKWVTIIGAPLMTAWNIYSIIDKKRRARICVFDKVVLMPVAVYIVIVDILLFLNNPVAVNSRQYLIGPLFIYIAIVYGIEVFYHYKHPIPMLLEEEKKKEMKDEEKK